MVGWGNGILQQLSAHFGWTSHKQTKPLVVQRAVDSHRHLAQGSNDEDDDDDGDDDDMLVSRLCLTLVKLRIWICPIWKRSDARFLCAAANKPTNERRCWCSRITWERTSEGEGRRQKSSSRGADKPGWIKICSKIYRYSKKLIDQVRSESLEVETKIKIKWK